MNKAIIFQKFLSACLLLPLTFFFVLGLLIQLLFGKKKKVDLDNEPDCLNDPKYGKHAYLELKTRNNLKIHYVANGDKSNPLMLFVHGFPQFWYTWKDQLVEFGRDYYAVAIDLPGYGYSDKPKDCERYDASEISQDVKAFINELGFESCILVGHDWGAGITFYTAVEYPEVVEKLINMNAPHKQAFLDNQSFTQLLKSSSLDVFINLPYFAEVYCSVNNYFFMEKVYEEASKEYYTEEEINVYKYMFHKSGFTGPLNYYRNNILTYPNKGTGNVNMPSVLIWGTEDSQLGIHLAASTGKYLVNGKVVYLDGISHFVHSDAPNDVLKHMREFLNGSS